MSQHARKSFPSVTQDEVLRALTPQKSKQTAAEVKQKVEGVKALKGEEDQSS